MPCARHDYLQPGIGDRRGVRRIAEVLMNSRQWRLGRAPPGVRPKCCAATSCVSASLCARRQPSCVRCHGSDRSSEIGQTLQPVHQHEKVVNVGFCRTDDGGGHAVDLLQLQSVRGTEISIEQRSGTVAGDQQRLCHRDRGFCYLESDRKSRKEMRARSGHPDSVDGIPPQFRNAQAAMDIEEHRGYLGRIALRRRRQISDIQQFRTQPREPDPVRDPVCVRVAIVAKQRP